MQTEHLGATATRSPVVVKLSQDFYRLVPDGAHCVVEERLHRGASVYAVVAIVPGGASVPLNGYSTQESAQAVADAVNDR